MRRFSALRTLGLFAVPKGTQRAVRRPPWPLGKRPASRGQRLRMETQTIQRQYDEVIAPHYDLDPQAVLGTSLNRAAHQIRQQHLPGNSLEPLRVLDLGVGTGLFLAKLKALAGDQIQPFGLDLSEKMIDCARD